MKLLYITNGINGSGGLERVLSVKASMLADHYGYDVTILVLNNGHLHPFYEFSPKINFVSIAVGGGFWSYFQSWRKGIAASVRNVDPDFISVCDDGLKGFFLPTFIKTKAKWIYERHVSKLIEQRQYDLFFQKISTRVKWALMARQAKKYDRFIVLTKGSKAEWPDLENLTVIPDPLPFSPQKKSSWTQKKVICVGKITFQKGQDLLVKAWAKIHRDFPDWELHLYGKENPSFLDTSRLGNNVFYHLPEKQIVRCYLDSSIYVMSSRFEGFGMVLIEAMACGLPCVAFDCPYGPSDIITDKEDGFLVDKEDVDTLSEKLRMLMADEKLRQQMGQKALKNVERFSATTIVAQWHELFQTLAD